MSSGKKTRLRGPATSYAFFIQSCRENCKRSDPETKIDFATFSRQCALQWKTLSTDKKLEFQKMAEKDKLRYKREVELNPELAKSKRKLKKDPFAPKKPLSAYFWFSGELRNKVKSQNPDFRVGDVAKELGKMWQLLDEDGRRVYVQMAEKDKQRYEKEMAVYNSSSKRGGGSNGPVAVVDIDDDDDEEEDEDEETESEDE